VKFQVLGPLQVSCDGRPLAVGGTRTRAVLAMLLVNANRVVAADTEQGLSSRNMFNNTEARD
jgi:DNA-binding SARP family transcriptional activator